MEQAGNRPAPVARWESVARRYLEQLGGASFVKGAWSLGSSRSGVRADLDLVLIVEPDAAWRQFDCARFRDAHGELTPDERMVMQHPPSAVLPQELAGSLGELFPVFECTTLWGVPAIAAPNYHEQPELALGLVADYALATYPGEFAQWLAQPTEPRGALARVVALRHAAVLATAAGIPVARSLHELVADARSATETARTAGEAGPLVARGLRESANLVRTLAHALSKRGAAFRTAALPAWAAIGERIRLVDRPRIEECSTYTRALMLRDANWGGNVAPLDLAWGFLWAVQELDDVRKVYGPTVRGVVRVVAAPPQGWQRRWEAVGRHARWLREHHCAAGYLHPNHLHVDPRLLYQ